MDQGPEYAPAVDGGVVEINGFIYRTEYCSKNYHALLRIRGVISDYPSGAGGTEPDRSHEPEVYPGDGGTVSEGISPG